jgi:hypothetical protein
MTRRRRPVFLVLGGAVALYFVALIGVSLSSKPRLLPPGQPLEFCGAYLDCHLSATFTGIELTQAGDGLLYQVKIKFANSATRATLRVKHPQVVMLADGDIRINPSAAPPLLELPPGASMEVDFVFPTPRPLGNPRLHVSEGGPAARLTEKLLIGDVDSFLHRPVLLSVRPT